MDRLQLVNDLEESIRYGLDSLQSRLWTAMPAIVQSVNLTKMTCVVQLAIQGVVSNPDGTTSNVNIKPLADCPIVFPNGGGMVLTFPLAAGDEVLVIMASRCIDAWFQSGGYNNVPAEMRMHDLSDGFAIPGPKSVPNAFSSISSSATQLRNQAGTTYMGIDGGSGKFQMQNPTTSLETILSNMNSAVTTLNTDLTTFATGLSVATLPAQSAALVTALSSLALTLANITTAIGALLE